jgi:hypothetical protein
LILNTVGAGGSLLSPSFDSRSGMG